MLFRIYIILALTALLSACSTTESLIITDDQGRIIKKTDEVTGTVTEWVYGTAGNVFSKKVTTSNGLATLFKYNSQGLITDIFFPDGKKQHYSYSSEGRIKSVCDTEGYITVYFYDKQGNPVKKVLPAGTAELDPAPPADPNIVYAEKPAFDKPARPTHVDGNINKTTFSYGLP